MTEEGTADSHFSCLISCFLGFFLRDVDLEIRTRCLVLQIWLRSSELNLAPAAPPV